MIKKKCAKLKDPQLNCFLCYSQKLQKHLKPNHCTSPIPLMGSSWSWSYGNWISNYLCNQCLSQLMLWVRIQLRRGVLDTTLCDQVCQWLATGRWVSPGTPVSLTNKTYLHEITEPGPSPKNIIRTSEASAQIIFFWWRTGPYTAIWPSVPWTISYISIISNENEI
jgi:hypothetical protein